MHLILFSISRG